MFVVLDSLTPHGKQRTMDRGIPIHKLAAYTRTHRMSIHKGHGDGMTSGIVDVPMDGRMYRMVLQLTKRVGMVQHANLITTY